MFLGFSSKYHRLDYLLDWCGLCFDGAPLVFPQNSPEELRLLGVLGARMEGLRYRQDPPSLTGIEILRARAHRLLELGNGAVPTIGQNPSAVDTRTRRLPCGHDEDFVLDTISVTPRWIFAHAA